MFSISTVFPLIIAYSLITRKEKLNETWYLKTIGSLYGEIKTDSKAALLYNAIFVSRRIIFTGISLLL